MKPLLATALLALTACTTGGGSFGTNADMIVTVTKPDGTKITYAEGQDQTTFAADLFTAVTAIAAGAFRVDIKQAEQATAQAGIAADSLDTRALSGDDVAKTRIGANKELGLEALRQE